MIQETITQDTTTHVEVRPFHVAIPDEALIDLRRRNHHSNDREGALRAR